MKQKSNKCAIETNDITKYVIQLLDYSKHYWNNIIIVCKNIIHLHQEKERKKKKVYPFRTVTERKQD